MKITVASSSWIHHFELGSNSQVVYCGGGPGGNPSIMCNFVSTVITFENKVTLEERTKCQVIVTLRNGLVTVGGAERQHHQVMAGASSVFHSVEDTDRILMSCSAWDVLILSQTTYYL
eukprot:2480498-Rhodomonas_salina.1